MRHQSPVTLKDESKLQTLCISAHNASEILVWNAVPWAIVCSLALEQLGRAFHRYRISITDRMQSSLDILELFSFSD